MKVEELSQYGKTLSGIPKEALKKQKQIVLREIRAKYGWLGTLSFFLRSVSGQRKLKKNYPEAYKKAKNISENAAKEVTMLVSMFNLIAQEDGDDQAYEFLKNVFQEMAVYSIPAFYQIDDLIQCEGDDYCDFMFYRKGAAPNTEHLNK